MRRTICKAATILRLRVCGSPACRALFVVCISCDRGQRYCSQSCRQIVRRNQRRSADRQYQQSERGRRSHCRRQRRYRERQAQARVTDQPLKPIVAWPPLHPPCLCVCAFCGRSSLWITPYEPIPRRWLAFSPAGQVGARSKKYAFR